MSEWTPSAQAELERYLQRVRESLGGSDVDPTEVIDDLKRHVAAEVAAAKLPIVTEEALRQILKKMGGPDQTPAAETPHPILPSNHPSSVGSERSRPAIVIPLLFGVVLPCITLIVEGITHMCAAAFFDPMPTLGHAFLLAMVPLVNLLCIRQMRKGRAGSSWLGWANGAVIGITSFYAIMFLPLLPFGMVGILFFGFGLLPLTPLLSLIATADCRRQWRRLDPEQSLRMPGLWGGLLLSLAVLMLIELPNALTRIGLNMANSDRAETREKGIRWLRAIGNEHILLRACYRGPQRGTDFITWILSREKGLWPEAARKIYFRVTGQPFNAVPPPKLYTSRGAWNVLEEEFNWEFDEGLGGDTVAGRVKGLSLLSSRLDGVVEPRASLAYLEWTLEFKNEAPRQREARAQILLPPGAVVSRLTLWVNGEEREAAFAGRGQVREAYQKVAVQRRRDPVLVTTCGPARVLMQCFPVPPNGGVMKVRLGITTPLVLESDDRALLPWPQFLERNFSLAPEIRHSLWLESPLPLESKLAELKADSSKPGLSALRGVVRDRELSDPSANVRVHRDPAFPQVWTPAAETNHVVRQTITPSDNPRPSRLVVVVDGSRGMHEYYPAIASILSQLPETMDFALVHAFDGSRPLTGKPQPGQRALLKMAAQRLRDADSVGGQDNIPALLEASDWAAEGAQGMILWIHGPQPVLLDDTGTLRQCFERRPGLPVLLDIQTRPGPNRIAEKLDGIAAVTTLPRGGELQQDLQRLVDSWNGKARPLKYTRELIDKDDTTGLTADNQGSKHVARLWALERVQQLRADRRIETAVALAALYQLVTPVSGAVVLENRQQYVEAGLTPVDPATVPAIPEPQTWLVLALGLALLVGRAKLVRPR